MTGVPPAGGGLVLLRVALRTPGWHEVLPSLLAREIQNGVRHFLTSGFEPSDPLFAGVVQRFIEDEARWIKGPYVQVGLPFRAGAHGTGFWDRFVMAHPGFFHQEATATVRK